MQVSISAEMPGNPRMVFYCITRDDGSEYKYGPVFTSDENYDPAAQCELMKARLEAEANG
jgi:hypothetical protein